MKSHAVALISFVVVVPIAIASTPTKAQKRDPKEIYKLVNEKCPVELGVWLGASTALRTHLEWRVTHSFRLADLESESPELADLLIQLRVKFEAEEKRTREALEACKRRNGIP